MVCHVLADKLLEEEWALLHDRVHLAVDENTGVDVLLGKVAQRLVLGHDSFIYLVDQGEILVGRVLVAENFITDQRVFGSTGDESLGEKEMGSVV